MAKISGIYVEIRGDATQLKKELASARQAVTQQAGGMSNALNNALSPAQLKNSINGLVKNLNQLSNASKVTGKDFAAIGADLGGLQRLTGLSAAEFGKLQSRMMQTSAAKAQEQALRSVAKAAGLSADEVQRLGRQMGVSAGSIAAVNGSTRSAAGSMDMLSRALGAALAYMSIGTVTGFARAVLDAGIAMDSLNRSFVAITGNEIGALETMGYLRTEAGRLGQNFYELAPAFKGFAAAARGTTLEGEKARKIFSSVVAAGTALGLSADQTKGTLLALEQMISKGTVSMEELRRQLGDRLPGAFGLAAKAMGVSTQELNKMVAEGKVMADDLLPKLANELDKTYGKAAQTAALESAQAAVNRLSQEWTEFKTNLFNSDQAVQGINRIIDVVRTLAEWANLRSVSKTFDQGAKLAADGVLDFEAFKRASFVDRQKMVDRGGSLNTWRGKVDRGAVAPAYTAPALVAAGVSASKAAESALARVQSEIAKLTLSAADFEHYQIDQEFAKIAKELGAANPLLKRWVDLRREEAEAIRGKSVDKELSDYFSDIDKGYAEIVKKAEAAKEKNLALVTEFADKYKAVVLGETEFKKAQIEAQADAYRKAGSDEIAVAQWVAAEKLKISRDWGDGATRALQSYTDSATNAALATESVMNTAFQGMEDMVKNFVETGKFEFTDFVNHVNSEIARLAFKSLASESYNWLGDMLKVGMSAAGSYFGGGTAVSSAAGSAGMAGTLSSLMSRSAKGNVFDSPGLSAYANSIVSQPTVFPFAKGVGLMGEAGPEAIMPLRRGPDGVLGIKAAGGGDDETKALLREIAAGIRAQKAQKNIFAFDKRTVANELSGSEGEQMTLTHVRRNPAAVRRILGL